MKVNLSRQLGKDGFGAALHAKARALPGGANILAHDTNES